MNLFDKLIANNPLMHIRPSVLDENEWRRILTHFGQCSVEISKAVAKIAQKTSIEILRPELLEPYNACGL